MSDSEDQSRPEGEQINLDKAEGVILEAYIENTILASCPFLHIVFESDYRLAFTPTPEYYLTYLTAKWVPAEMNESTGTSKRWHYELECNPTSVYEWVTEPIEKASDLARAMNIELAEGSDDLEFPIVLKNQLAGNLLNDLQFYMFEESYKTQSLGDVPILYAGSETLTCIKLSSIMSAQSLQLKFSGETTGANLITRQDSELLYAATCARNAKPWKGHDYIRRILGMQFKVETGVPATFLQPYTIKLDDRSDFDTGLTLLCSYSKVDLMEKNAFVHVFSYLKEVE